MCDDHCIYWIWNHFFLSRRCVYHCWKRCLSSTVLELDPHRFDFFLCFLILVFCATIPSTHYQGHTLLLGNSERYPFRIPYLCISRATVLPRWPEFSGCCPVVTGNSLSGCWNVTWGDASNTLSRHVFRCQPDLVGRVFCEQ